MASWKKVDNEAGYPCYIRSDTTVRQYDHPEFGNILINMDNYKNIKYAVYRTAYKIYEWHSSLKVPPARISLGVFARHCLSISESSLSLEACELEAVLTDIYFASSKEGIFTGDIDKMSDLMLNFLYNVFDPDRKTTIRVQSAKCILILLSGDCWYEKWRHLFKMAADHNGCISARRLTSLLTQVACLCEYSGEESNFGQHLVQQEVDRCFSKTPGMLGLSEHMVMQWLNSDPAPNLISWLPVYDRILLVKNANKQSSHKATVACASCKQCLGQGLKFQCTRCCNLFLCERCYLYEDSMKSISGHKKTHIVNEVFDVENIQTECMSSFVKSLKKLFTCSDDKARPAHLARKEHSSDDEKKACTKQGELSKKAVGDKPTMFTSTVGKASGNVAANPTLLLQDIIVQLESQNRVLKDLSHMLALDSVKNMVDGKIRYKVDSHWDQILTQINRLKLLKDTLAYDSQNDNNHNKKSNKKLVAESIQVFDMFSPISAIQEEQQIPKQADTKCNIQPRVLSLDSGHFSSNAEVRQSEESQQLMTTSGGMMKPIVVHAISDSISTVSMNDISAWFSIETDSSNKEVASQPQRSESALEEKFDADMQCVASSNHKMKELNADLDSVLDRLQQILANNFVLDDACFDNNQLKATANEMEGLLGTLIRGVEQRRTMNAERS